MSDQVLKERAQTLLALHQPGNPVVLPTVWDAWSARLAADAGFAALTVGSHPMADSVGKADREGMTFDDVITRVKQITAAVDVPSYRVEQYDIITVRKQSVETLPLQVARETYGDRPVPAWLQVVPGSLQILIHQLPTRAQIDTVLTEQLIVEYYSKT